MYQYILNMGKELWEIIQKASKEQNMTEESFIIKILNKYLVPLHTIDKEAMAEGYKDMSELNLELCK